MLRVQEVTVRRRLELPALSHQHHHHHHQQQRCTANPEEHGEEIMMETPGG